MRKRFLVVLAILLLTPFGVSAQCPNGNCQNGQCSLQPQQPLNFGGWQKGRFNENQIDARNVTENRVIQRTPTLAWRLTKREGHYRSVVRVMGRTGTNANWEGSGCAVRWGNSILILTAEHMLRGTTQMLAEGQNGYQVCKVLGRDQTWDVAVLEPENPSDFIGAEIAWTRDGQLKPGDHLESCGMAEGKLAVNRGILRGWGYAKSSRPKNTDWLIMSGLARQGDSGGPVFRRKKLVGILWGTNQEEKAVTATQLGRLHLILKKSLGSKRYEENRRLIDLNLGLGCRPDKKPTPAQRDPRVDDTNRKLDTLINQQQQQPKVKAKESKTSPMLMAFLAVIVAGVLWYGFGKN